MNDITKRLSAIESRRIMRDTIQRQGEQLTELRAQRDRLVDACRRAERYFIEKERDGMTSDMALTVKIGLTNALADAEGGA